MDVEVEDEYVVICQFEVGNYPKVIDKCEVVNEQVMDEFEVVEESMIKIGDEVTIDVGDKVEVKEADEPKDSSCRNSKRPRILRIPKPRYRLAKRRDREHTELTITTAATIVEPKDVTTVTTIPKDKDVTVIDTTSILHNAGSRDRLKTGPFSELSPEVVQQIQSVQSPNVFPADDTHNDLCAETGLFSIIPTNQAVTTLENQVVFQRKQRRKEHHPSSDRSPPLVSPSGAEHPDPLPPPLLSENEIKTEPVDPLLETVWLSDDEEMDFGDANPLSKVRDSKIHYLDVKHGTRTDITLFKINGEQQTQANDTDSDDDDDALPLPVPVRDASTEPSIPHDMSTLAQRVLSKEDKLNDRAIRRLVSKDCDLDFDWSFDVNQFGQRETFTANAGLAFKPTSGTTIVEVFHRMFNHSFIDLLCVQTNLYASQQIAKLTQQNKLRPNARLSRWVPTERDEMIGFLALTILQGLYPIPEESYFSFNGFGTMPYFRKVMSYNRYLLLKCMIHFVDNSTLTSDGVLPKIQPIIDYFNKQFKKLYTPSQDIVIDEGLVTSQGRIGYTGKIERNKGAAKMYELCEASTGYLWSFCLDPGKDEQTDETLSSSDTDDDRESHRSRGNKSGHMASAKIVYDLMKPLLGRGYTLILDNFYNCPLLARFLKKRKTDCYGTVRLNREFMPNSLDTAIKSDYKRNEILGACCSELSIILWRDGSLVSLISTYHRLEFNMTHTNKPSIVLDYNESMKAVDKKHQFLSTQPIEFVKSQVWYKKVFRRIFNSALFNCFIIYNSLNSTVSHRQFRIMLAEGLLRMHRQIDLTAETKLIKTKTDVAGEVIKPAESVTAPRLDFRHFPVKVGSKQYRCVSCAQRRIVPRMTVWQCQECDAYLCHERDCFIEFHNTK